jgi:hypothetical protein
MITFFRLKTETQVTKSNSVPISNKDWVVLVKSVLEKLQINVSAIYISHPGSKGRGILDAK